MQVREAGGTCIIDPRINHCVDALLTGNLLLVRRRLLIVSICLSRSEGMVEVYQHAPSWLFGVRFRVGLDFGSVGFGRVGGHIGA